jgi:hypothetical protein
LEYERPVVLDASGLTVTSGVEAVSEKSVTWIAGAPSAAEGAASAIVAASGIASRSLISSPSRKASSPDASTWVFPFTGSRPRGWTNVRDLLPRVGRDSEMTKRLLWSGLLAAFGALASIAASRVAATVYRRIFDEDPPD